MPPTTATTDDGDDKEYRVVRRSLENPSAEWRVVITQRGLGRPFRSLPAARGVMTRARRSTWNRRYEYKTQWRPVTTEWSDV